jgi:hypothetical protein
MMQNFILFNLVLLCKDSFISLSSSTPKNKKRKLKKKLWECVVQAKTMEDVDEWKEVLREHLR